jgi:hypothetical protein
MVSRHSRCRPGHTDWSDCLFRLKSWRPRTHCGSTSITLVGGLTFPRFNLVTGKVVPVEKGWRRLDRRTGELVNVKVKRKNKPETDVEATALLEMPFAEIESADADVLLQPGATPAGHVHAELSDGKFTYHIDWAGAQSDVYELGWIFPLPKGVERFSWDRKAVWSYYPPDHIGRASGTATPDSAHVDLTDVARPDAFDFTSTKFNCNWASLTDADSRGLCVSFAPEQRHHVRAGIDSEGNCTLIVNRCYSPPRDISSPIVPDLYTVLKNDGQVSGSFQILGANQKH